MVRTKIIVLIFGVRAYSKYRSSENIVNLGGGGRVCGAVVFWGGVVGEGWCGWGGVAHSHTLTVKADKIHNKKKLWRLAKVCKEDIGKKLFYF